MLLLAAAMELPSGPVSQVQQYLERISQLPRAKQRAVMQVLDAMLAQQGR